MDGGEGSRSGRSISQQLYDSVVRGTPWDDDLSGAPTGLSKEDEDCIREMKPDILEMARDADRENTPVRKYFCTFFTSAAAYLPPRLHCVGVGRLHHRAFPRIWQDDI